MCLGRFFIDITFLQSGQLVVAMVSHAHTSQPNRTFTQQTTANKIKQSQSVTHPMDPRKPQEDSQIGALSPRPRVEVSDYGLTKLAAGGPVSRLSGAHQITHSPIPPI